MHVPVSACGALRMRVPGLPCIMKTAYLAIFLVTQMNFFSFTHLAFYLIPQEPTMNGVNDDAHCSATCAQCAELHARKKSHSFFSWLGGRRLRRRWPTLGHPRNERWSTGGIRSPLLYTAQSSSAAHPALATPSGDAQVGDAEAGAERGGMSAGAGGAIYE